MTGNEIAAELKLVGSSQAEIARELGFKYMSRVNNVVHYLSKNPKIRSAIAKKLNLPVHMVFDDCNNTNVTDKVKRVNG